MFTQIDPRLGEGASISYPLFSHYCHAAQTTTKFCGEILAIKIYCTALQNLLYKVNKFSKILIL